MKLLVLGAAGATGRVLVDAATAAGHDVVALVRDPQRLEPRPGVHVATGDARDVDALVTAAQGVDALVSTLGLGGIRTPPDDLIRDASRAAADTATRTGFRRLVWMSALGVGDSYAKSSLPVRLGCRVAPGMFRDKLAGETVLRAADLDWTIAYPGGLTDGPRTGTVTPTDLDAVTRIKGLPKISRADVADFLLTAATSDTWSRRTVVLTTAG